MLSNRYVQRRVADKDAQRCFLCYRPTPYVMVNEVPNADFFYACASHINDPGFAFIHKDCQIALNEREKKQKEIDLLRRQWEELQKKKKAKADKDTKDDTVKSNEEAMHAEPNLKDAAPVKVIYELHRGVYNLRINAKRRIVQEKKTKSILETPGMFPSTPKHKPV